MRIEFKNIFYIMFILISPLLVLGLGFFVPLLIPLLFILTILFVLPAYGFYYGLNKIANFPQPYEVHYKSVERGKSLIIYNKAS
ncbi:MAG: hypothetical protein KDD58_11985 [Bdellovibrionales bacterium]|nr:hypothetical protein [Bdellovibrionales bacterium]